MTNNFLQVDAYNDNQNQSSNAIRLVINTPFGCFTALMSPDEYNSAVRSGFFIRDGKTKDSAGCINTTAMYAPQVDLPKYTMTLVMEDNTVDTDCEVVNDQKQITQ